MIETFLRFTWINVLDILIVTFIIYRVFLLIQGTRAVQMLIGLAVLMTAFFISQQIELSTVNWILRNFFGALVLVIIVLFQPELRRALTYIGRSPFFEVLTSPEEAQILNSIITASISLANKKIGALIVIERETGLKNYIEGGIVIDGKITKEILSSIFLPYSPIHDGAVIIEGTRIAAAGCFLPLSLNPNISKALGTRHRAAIGLTEETDAIVIVVSEETGTISMVIGGEITQNLDGVRLRKVLEESLLPKVERRRNILGI